MGPLGNVGAEDMSGVDVCPGGLLFQDSTGHVQCIVY